MSQHDYVIDNQSGSLFRSDLNSVLAATVTTNSGAAAPATMYAYMMWADTTSGWLKQRNSANTAWVKLFRLSNAAASRRPVLSKGADYTVVEADFGSIIRATTALTLSLTAAATMEDGFTFSFRNDGVSDCTIDPSGAETINGSTTIPVAAGASLDIYCSGTAWYTVSGATIQETGSMKLWPTSSAPTGWLNCDGSAVSRTTYATLYGVLGTTFGAGDGSTTFNLPDFRGRVPLGYASSAPTVTASGVDANVDTTNNTLAVTSNTRKWHTGMTVVFTLSSGTITGLTSSTTYYVIRNSATTLKLASSIANAQNGTAIDFTAKSSPVWTLTHTMSARPMAEAGGEEDHAMSQSETPPHNHTQNSHLHTAYNSPSGSGAVGGLQFATGLTAPAVNTGSTTATNIATAGGVAANIMQPYLTSNIIIKT
jgi:microcystin-dependent protein